jgi:hypothetical protein
VAVSTFAAKHQQPVVDGPFKRCNMLLPADYPNTQNFILHYADMVDSTSLTNLLKCVRSWGCAAPSLACYRPPIA